MVINSTGRFVAIAAALACAARATAGPDWTEVGDAGSLPATSQRVTTTGTVSRIHGSLSTGLVADLEDMYLIQITNPVTFSARTDMLPGVFDTQLWLFDLSGHGLLANDDVSAVNHGSRIAPPATDGTGQIIPAPGCYYLAITGHFSAPSSASGAIFIQASLTEISGPDGVGAGNPITNWSPSGGPTGTYRIDLVGVAGAPLGCLSYNVDVGTSVSAGAGFGAPSPALGGPANQPGTWNNLAGAATMLNLVVLDGTASGVTLTRSTAAGGDFAFNNANTSGDFQLLIDDGQNLGASTGNVTYTFSGLANGNYDVYTVAVAPDVPTTDYTNVTVVNSTSPNPQSIAATGGMPMNMFVQGQTHAVHNVQVTSGTIQVMVDGAPGSFGTLNGIQVRALPAPPTIVSASPPNGHRDTLQNTTTGLAPQGIGVLGTPNEGAVTNYGAPQVTFSGTPSPAPTPANIAVSCTGGSCPTVTTVAGAGAGPYTLSLSGQIPVLHCITFLFAGTNAGQKLQYSFGPGDMNLNSIITGQDVLSLVTAINTNMPILARHDVNRNATVSGQDVLRLVQLINGGVNVSPPAGYNGAAIAPCP